MPKSLTVVVVSDLHATSKPPGDAAGSWLTTTTPRSIKDHPLEGLKDYLITQSVNPDLILCAGDICDKADEAALQMAWADLVEIASAVGAKLVATAGNHDLDSRNKNDLDPRGVLYDLEPPFPALDETSRDQYWGKNYAILEAPLQSGDVTPPWRVVTVNSSAFHGYTSEDGPELEHGRVSPRTTRRLRDDLDSRTSAQTNILLVHHHLEQLPDVDLKDRSQIRDGEQLARMLEIDSPWLVVHGHKHRSYIHYAHGDGSSATIFAAGSLSAYPSDQVAATAVANQAYIIRFAAEEVLEQLELGIAAEFESLSWKPERGWKISSVDQGLPGRGGFGWRTDTRRLAKKIGNHFAQAGVHSMTNEDIYAFEPRLRYLVPGSLTGLKDNLAKLAPPIILKRSEDGEIESLKASVALDVLTETLESA